MLIKYVLERFNDMSSLILKYEQEKNFHCENSELLKLFCSFMNKLMITVARFEVLFLRAMHTCTVIKLLLLQDMMLVSLVEKMFTKFVSIYFPEHHLIMLPFEHSQLSKSIIMTRVG